MTSSWLGDLTTGILRNFLNPEVSPNKVIEVEANFGNRLICCREDAIVLYGPTKEEFEIVFHRPCSETRHQAFSLFRSRDRQEAETRFIQLKDKVSPLVDVCKDVCNAANIQKICDAVRENPSWTVAHLAVHLNLLEFLQHPSAQEFLNCADVHTGISPLQCAIHTGNQRIINALITLGASLEHVDNEGNSVFHYAASTNTDIVALLANKSSTFLNFRNIKGYTPLHEACKADKPDCVKALLMAGADVNISAVEPDEINSPRSTSTGIVSDFLQGRGNPNKLHTQDMKFGGTPLHWSCSREVIDALVDTVCDIDCLNFDKRTALHIMVLRKRLPCVVALLSREANVNIGDCDGNTPLHLAALQNDITVVQALIVFGAELNSFNNCGNTPRHMVPLDDIGKKILYMLHAVGAPRCPPGTKGCTEACSHIDNGVNGTPPPVPPGLPSREILDQMLFVEGMRIRAERRGPWTKGGRVLCLDGGGIRGLVLIVCLLELEKAVKRPLGQCFDWIAGTSTGGILTLGMAAGKSLRECLCMYFRMKDLTFVGTRPYSAEPLENILKETLGESTVMTDIKHPKVIVTGVLADRKPVELHLFRNYESPSDILNVEINETFEVPSKPSQQTMWSAARASGAAPTYFRTFNNFLDGGLIANNPTLDVLTEIHEYNLALTATNRESEVKEPTVVVSVGTGKIPVSQVAGFDLFRPESLWDTAKLAFGFSQLGHLLVDQATASEGRVIDRARAWCSMIGVPYYRFCPQMSEDVGMDERNDQILVNLLWETRAYMHSHLSSINELAVLLNKE